MPSRAWKTMATSNAIHRPFGAAGFGSSKGLCRTCIASIGDVSDMGHHLLVLVFAHERHAVEPVVLQHVHHAHEVAVEHVLVGPDEDPLLLRVALGAEAFPQVV